MIYLIKKVKLITTLAVGFTFVMGVTLSSCTSSTKSSDETEAVDEHPSDSEAAATNEHPMDSAAVGGEHPEGGDEHPADSSSEENTKN